MHPIVLIAGETYNKDDGTYYQMGEPEKYLNTTQTVFRAKGGSEYWTPKGGNFPGHIDQSKALTNWIHPAVAEKLRAYDAHMAGAPATPAASVAPTPAPTAAPIAPAKPSRVPPWLRKLFP
jgi:hypothetical protein